MRRGVFLAVALLAAALPSACGGDGGTPNEGPVEGSLGDVLSRPGDDIALVPGTSDYARGAVRVVFLVIDSRGKSIERPSARVWVARSLGDKPFVETTARLENVGVPGVSEAAAGDVTHVYVARVRLPQAGKYVLVADRAPFVLAFATPKFCTSRACGPVVDVVDHVRKRLGQSPVRFIHVEIYEDNQPPETNRWVKEWKLPTEPWVFLVGRDGRIKARFEGSVSAAELEAAVRRLLL